MYIKKNNYNTLIFSTFIFLLVSIKFMTAADYYVATNGNNTDPGTLAQPWRTIQKAANTAQAGDTVYVRTGKYNEQVIIQNSGNASSGYITFKNYNNEYVIIDGTGITMDYPWHGLVHIDGKNYIRIQGFHIRNVPRTNNYASLLIQTWLAPSSHIEILDNEISLHTNHVVALWANGNRYSLKNVLIDNNEVHHCHTYWMEAIRVGGYVTNFIISHNHVHHTYNIGIDVVGRTTQGIPAYGLIKSNICYSNSQGVDWASGIYSDGGNYITIENNIVSNSYIGITLGGEETNSQTVISHHNIARNNICYNNRYNMALGGVVQSKPCIVKHCIIRNNHFISPRDQNIRIFSAQSNYVENNIFYNSHWNTLNTNIDHNTIPLNRYNYNCYPVGAQGYVQVALGTNNIFADPLFVNSTTRNFHLTPASPCINQGNPSTVLGADETDMDGQNRINTIIDMGAYEYYSSGYFNPLPSPLWISATAVSTNQIDLLWRNQTNQTGYYLYRSENNNTNGAVKIKDVDQNITNYSDVGLKSKTIYYYWLKTFNLVYTSGFSSPISQKTLSQTVVNHTNDINFDKSKLRVLPNYIGPNDINEVYIYLGGLTDPETQYKLMIWNIAGEIVKDLGSIDYSLLNKGIKYILSNKNNKKIKAGVYLVVVIGKNEKFMKKLYIGH